MANDLRIRVHGDTTSYERGMERAASATAKYKNSLTSLEVDLMKLQKQMDDDMASALRKQHDAMEKVGKGMLVAGAAIATGLGLAVNEAIKWESAWAGVTKVVDGSPEQMAALETQLRNLATTLPATHAEIAAVAEAAGQLGVKRADVAAFTKVMVDMGVSTNLSADEAATAMARFANIMGTPISEVDRLGSAIVALGNDGASTEAEIVTMALRIAGAGRQIGLSEADVLALANALSSVGIEAEAGGSAISTVMINIEKAVRSGGEEVEAFARVAGVSAQEFTEHWQRDPAAALVLFERGLAAVEAQGGDTFGILEELGITEIRQRDAVLRLSGAHEILNDSLATGAASWEENAALVEEANKRYETAESRIKVAKNQLVDLGIDLGGVLLPAVASAAEALGDLFGWFANLPGPVKSTLTILGSAAGALALAGGAALIAIPKLHDLSETFTDLGIGGERTSRIMRGFGRAMAIAPVIIAAAVAVDQLNQQISKVIGTPIADDVDAMARSLLRLGHSGELSGELTKAFGSDFEGVVRRFRADGDSFGETAARLSEPFDDLPDFLDAGAKSFKAIDDALASLVQRGFTEQAADGFAELAAEAEKQGVSHKELLKLFPQYEGALEELALTQDIANEKANEAATATGEFGDVAADTADDVAELERKVGELRDGLALLNGEALSAEETAIRFREQIRQMKKDVDDHGASLKANTKAGDANRQMLLDAIEASRDAAEAEFDKTVKTKGHEAAVRAANSTMRENINTLLDEATQLGLNKTETERYIARILGVPVKSLTKFTAPGLAEALAKARELDGQADALDGREVNTYFTTYDTRVTRFVRGRQIDLPAAGGPVSDYEPIVPMRRGGVVSGPGGPVDDAAGLFALSNGEYIVNAAATRANRRLLDAINSGGARDTGRMYATGSRSGSQGMGGITVENLNLTAFSNDFSLSQVRDRLALEGVA